MAKLLRAHNALPVDMSSIPSTPAVWIRTTCNSCSRRSEAPLLASKGTALMYTNPHSDTQGIYIFKNKIKTFLKK